MTVKVMGRDINVVIVPDPELEKISDTEMCLGLFKDDTIYLASSLTGEKKTRIFKHELVHAVFSVTGLTNLLDENLEEAIADAMENFDVPNI